LALHLLKTEYSNILICNCIISIQLREEHVIHPVLPKAESQTKKICQFAETSSATYGKQHI